MRCVIHNTDILSAEDIRTTPMVAHFFADTQMSVRHVQYDSGLRRVQVMPAADAFDSSKRVHALFFDFAETPDADLDGEFEHIFGRYPRAHECYQSMMALPWTGEAAPPEGKAFRTKRGGVLILRALRSGASVYSPFKRIPALTALPRTWSKDDLVRALHNGQFESITATVPALAAAEDGVLAPRVDANDLTRQLVEDHWLSWTIAPADGGRTLAVSSHDTRASARSGASQRFEVVPAFVG